MEYKGKLYAKVGGKYIECTETVQQLESIIKELEQTIENLKAISGEKIHTINTVSSVDYTTELIIEMDDLYGIDIPIEITKTKCCGIAPIINENFCPNCGRKIIKK